MGIKEYFMLDFNVRPNHKCVRRDNISKMGWGYHRFSSSVP
jgi:hypothetical protein